MKLFHSMGPITIAALCAVGCGSNDNTTSGDTSDVGGSPSASSSDVLMAQDSAQSADDASSSDNSTEGHGPSPAFLFADDLVHDIFLNDTVTFDSNFRAFDCNGTITGNVGDVNQVWTLDANLTFDGNACSGLRKVSGTTSIVATWDGNFSTYARTIDATTALTTTFSDGSYVALTTLDTTKPYTAQLQATGQAVNGNTQVIVSLNEHRVLYGPKGVALYDHNVTSPTPVIVQNSYTVVDGVPTPSSRTLASGEVDVHHNLAHFLAKHTFKDLNHDLTGTCACPSSGSLVQEVTLDSGKGGYTRTYDFTGCGVATVTTSASTLAGTAEGSATLTWNDCQN